MRKKNFKEKKMNWQNFPAKSVLKIIYSKEGIVVTPGTLLPIHTGPQPAVHPQHYRSNRSQCNFIKKETPAQVLSCEFCKKI